MGVELAMADDKDGRMKSDVLEYILHLILENSLAHGFCSGIAG